MTRIEFHVFASGADGARIAYASDWLASFGGDVRAHIHCDASLPPEAIQPLLARHIHITVLQPVAAPPRPDRSTVLINLAETVPPYFSRYRRTVDIADKRSVSVEADRMRYRFYRDRGYPLTLHQLEAEEVA